MGVRAAAHLLWWLLFCLLWGHYFCSRGAVSSFPPTATGLSALAAPPWCVSSANLGTPAVSTRCLAAGCPSGVPLLAPLFRMADRPGSAPLPPMSSWLWALHRGAGGGLLLPGLRVSGSGCRLLPDPFRRFSVPPLAGLEGQGCGD